VTNCVSQAYFIFLLTIQSILAFTRVLSRVPGPLVKIHFETVFKKSVVLGRSLFFLGPNLNHNTTLNSAPNLYSAENIAFASVGSGLYTVTGWIDCNMWTVVCGALPLTFWFAAKHLELISLSTCESKENSQGERILYQFNRLKIITRLINSIWAPLVISNVIHGALALAWIHGHAVKGNQYTLVYIIIVIVLLIFGAIIMAEGCRVVSHRKMWSNVIPKCI